MLKYIVISLLERFCHYVWDGLFVRWDLGAWFFYDVLNVRICPFATWSFELDEKWRTGYWKFNENHQPQQ